MKGLGISAVRLQKVSYYNCILYQFGAVLLEVYQRWILSGNFKNVVENLQATNSLWLH